jgi:bifunctional UDP-N-acetylglucosamine pyrophosphorylase/glucosamine-1-phosphate N-acetyltransferase
MKKNACVIMAAGKGTRMKSNVSKLLHQVAGKAIIDYTIDLAIEMKLDKIVLVLGHQREEIQAHLQHQYPDLSFDFAYQHEQLGTAHAVSCAEPFLKDFDGNVWILSGDVPALTSEILKSFEASLDPKTIVAVAGMYLEDPKSYGRLLFDDQNQLYAIREAKDCTAEQSLTKTVNAGLYRADAKVLFEALRSFDRKNAQGEYYLTDLVEYASQRKIPTQAWVCKGEWAASLEGVNDRYDLWLAQQRITSRINKKAMLSGVTLAQPDQTYIEASVKFGQDIKIESSVSLIGHCQIGSHVLIEQGCRLEDTIVEDGAVVHAYTVAVKSKIGAKSQIGPFARLREGTVLEENVKIGNFVETKKVHMQKGAKASHLSYLGDAKIGTGTNIGAGVITCNYDGFDKFHTEIGNDVFVGSDCQLVAPVKIADGAIIAAGTTVTKEVPANALTLSRSPQLNKEEWAIQFKAKKKNKRT